MITALHERRGIDEGGVGLSLDCTGNYRTEEQLEEMRRLESAGICLFCPAALREHARQRVTFETMHWAVTPNAFPYQGTRLHLLVVPHQHATDMVDLDDEVLADLRLGTRLSSSPVS